jgi:hypothetical protein
VSVEHGIAAAYYSNTPNGLMATLECTCGAICEGTGWREAGIELDEHLDPETEGDDG